MLHVTDHVLNMEYIMSSLFTDFTDFTDLLSFYCFTFIMPPRRAVTNAQLLTKLNSMDTKLNSMDTKLDGVKLKQEEMEKTIRYRMYIIHFQKKKFRHIINFFLEEMRSVARTRNAVLYNGHQNIELLLTDQGGMPMNYPERAIDIMNIPDDEII